MDASALASAESWLSWIAFAKLIAAFLVAAGVVIEFGGDWVARPFEKIVKEAGEARVAALNNETARLSAEAEAARGQIANATKAAATADAHAADANERAAKLEIEAAAANARTAEIMKATAWRGFTTPQIASLRSSLSGDPSKIVIGWILGDAESLSLATQFANILKEANPSWNFMSDAKAYETALVFGIYIPTVLGGDEEVEMLRDAFTRAGIVFKIEDLPKSTGMGFGDPGSKEHLAVIFFGSKEPAYTQSPF